MKSIYNQPIAGMDELKALYAPGGGYTAGIEAQLARLGKKTMATGMSNLVNSGMAGSSLPGNLANKFAEETAAPTLASAEQGRIAGLSGVMNQQAQLELQRRAGLTGVMGQEASYWANLYNQNANRSSNWPSTPLGGSIFDKQPSGGGSSTPQPQGDTTVYGAGFNHNPSSAYPSVNVGDTNQSILPSSLRSAIEPNWVDVNGRRFTEDANGNYMSGNTPLGLGTLRQSNPQTLSRPITKPQQTYPQGWEGPN
jgi:hypothetical protein